MQHKYVISCDWGTSSLRLQLVETATQRCLAKVSSSEGNAAIFNRWKAQNDTDRIAFYLRHLQPLLKELSASSGIVLNDSCIIISGMATSSVGVKELPYTDVPFNLNGSSAYTEWIDAKPVVDNPLLLISGVQQPDDVMRGEETQVVGIAALFDLPGQKDLLFILPGTHSKHILVKNNNITSFRTFMTGEIFEMLRKHSILSHAIADPPVQGISEEDTQSFEQGVDKGLKSELLNTLFSVRVNQLKRYLSPEQNYFYLSGLLIGSELKHITENLKYKLVLCSTGSLLQLYRTAIEVAELSEHTIVVPAEILDNAAMAGQLKILNGIKSISTHGR